MLPQPRPRHVQGVEVATAATPWDRNPLLERLERNRVLHLASSEVQLTMARRAEDKVGSD